MIIELTSKKISIVSCLFRNGLSIIYTNKHLGQLLHHFVLFFLVMEKLALQLENVLKKNHFSVNIFAIFSWYGDIHGDFIITSYWSNESKYASHKTYFNPQLCIWTVLFESNTVISVNPRRIKKLTLERHSFQ